MTHTEDIKRVQCDNYVNYIRSDEHRERMRYYKKSLDIFFKSPLTPNLPIKPLKTDNNSHNSNKLT